MPDTALRASRHTFDLCTYNIEVLACTRYRTYAVLRIAGTPRAVAQSSLGFGAFSYVIDRMGQQPADAAATTVCCDADGTCKRQMRQVCTAHAQSLNLPTYCNAVQHSLCGILSTHDWRNVAKTYLDVRLCHKTVLCCCVLVPALMGHCLTKSAA